MPAGILKIRIRKHIFIFIFYSYKQITQFARYRLQTRSNQARGVQNNQ